MLSNLFFDVVFPIIRDYLFKYYTKGIDYKDISL